MFRKESSVARSGALTAPNAHSGPPTVAMVSAGPAKSPFDGFSGDGAVLIGKGTRSAGEINDATVVEIQGDFEGNVAGGTVIIREGATFKGNMRASQVEVHGLLEGAVIAEQLLQIRATGQVTAEVRYGQLSVDAGGRISGNIQTNTIDGDLRTTGYEYNGHKVVPLTASAERLS